MDQPSFDLQAHAAAALAAWNEGDFSLLEQLVAPGLVRRSAPSLHGDANGLEELKQVIVDSRTSFPDGKLVLDELFALGNRSFVRWTYEGTNTGPGDFPATGRRLKVSGTTLSRYEGGMLVEEFVYFDALDMLKQLGFELAHPARAEPSSSSW